MLSYSRLLAIPSYLQIPLFPTVLPNSVLSTSFQNAVWTMVQSMQLANVGNQKDGAPQRYKDVVQMSKCARCHFFVIAWTHFSDRES